MFLIEPGNATGWMTGQSGYIFSESESFSLPSCGDRICDHYLMEICVSFPLGEVVGAHFNAKG